jgi:iron complex outermembrane recepter protein
VISYQPKLGANAAVVLRQTGARFLDKSNTAVAAAFVTVDVRLGWRFNNGLGIFADGRNLGDRRDPISESEIGDAQFYTLPGRSLMATVEWRGQR